MLEEKGVTFDYREYTERPLSEVEIRALLARLGVGAGDVLRRRDPVFRDLGLTGEESEAELVRFMAEHPALLQRPIIVAGARAVLGRPPEKILDIIDCKELP